jgi:HSP20 family protein
MAQDTKIPARSSAQSPGERPLDEWHPFATVRREIDRMFDDLWRFPFYSSPNTAPAWQAGTLAVDVIENPSEFRVTAELPGLDDKNIEVKCAAGVLTIKGEKREEREEKKEDYFLSERRFGSFQRSFRLPESVDADRIEAAFKNGLLTVTLPKKAEAQKNEKKISIKAG